MDTHQNAHGEHGGPLPERLPADQGATVHHAAEGHVGQMTLPGADDGTEQPERIAKPLQRAGQAQHSRGARPAARPPGAWPAWVSIERRGASLGVAALLGRPARHGACLGYEKS